MTTEVRVRVVKTAGVEAVLPDYQHPGDAGLDLRAVKAVRIEPGRRTLVATGLSFALPPGVVGIIKDRSGLSLKAGLHVMAGVIDSGYRGEVKVLLINLGEAAYQVKKGERVAQLILLPCLTAVIEQVRELPPTTRNEQGFGSTGKR